MASSTMDLYDHSFYPFSIIHADIKKAEFVMSHKELLFPNVPTREKKSFDNHKAMGLHQNREYTSPLLSNTNLHYLIDEDVHNGIIFNQDNNNNNNNLYDILIQGHYEYVTLNRCYIFKKFVENGEIIISLNANTFYAEVNYDILNNQITFVKCHYWAFDGEKAMATCQRKKRKIG